MLEKLQQMLRDYKGDQSIVITRDTTFSELEFDSLAVVEFLMNIEDEFGVTVEATHAIKTVGDLLDIIEKK